MEIKDNNHSFITALLFLAHIEKCTTEQLAQVLGDAATAYPEKLGQFRLHVDYGTNAIVDEVLMVMIISSAVSRRDKFYVISPALLKNFGKKMYEEFTGEQDKAIINRIAANLKQRCETDALQAAS